MVEGVRPSLDGKAGDIEAARALRLPAGSIVAATGPTWTSTGPTR